MTNKQSSPKTTRIPRGKLRTELLFPLGSVLSNPDRANPVRTRPTTVISGKCAQVQAGAARKTLPHKEPHQQLRLHQAWKDDITGFPIKLS